MRYVFALAVAIGSFSAHAADKAEVQAPNPPAQEVQVSRDVASLDVDAALSEIQTDIEKAVDAPDVSAGAD